jgi:predicted nucleic acid-binding protein
VFLDTTFCIDLLREAVRKEHGPATVRIEELADRPVFVSVFVLCELHAGARLSGNPKRELRRVESLTEHLAVVYPDATFPVTYAELEAYTRRNGVPVPTMDLLIGAMAKARGLPLLTRDTEHFARIPGLVLETY